MVRSSDAQDVLDVERVLAGDTAAFAGIVNRWQRPLLNLAFRFCRDRGRAEDLAQEAFLRAYRSLRQWRHDAAFSTWLFAVSLNVFRTEVRRIPAWDASLETDRPGTGPSPEGTAVTSNRDELVRRTVSTLPARYRDALILFYFLDQDVSEAAACLGVPPGTLKARLARGRGLLRARLPRVLGLP